ncbi:MAG: hypothetical protein H6733_15105 [Alphaproteobacteria bacterium]|nr:hypothetical protein [Alphaproteobacteria bacterium]
MRVLFLVNGLGLGNATRCHALLEVLAARGHAAEVVTGGNGAWYLRGRPEAGDVHEVGAFAYAERDGALSVAGTVLSAGRLLRTARANEAVIARVIAARRPDVVVTDSTYTVCPVRRAGVPLVALNNADVVHTAWRRLPDPPASTRAQLLVVEDNDWRFHRWATTLTLSPCLDPTLPQTGPPYRRIGPVVRRGLARRVGDGPVRRVLVMLSGSTLSTAIRLDAPPAGVTIDVVGRARPDDVPAHPGVTWHGKVRDNRALLAQADLAVVNGGFSAVSELYWLGVPLLVLPVPRHAEQWVNAATIAQLGVGAVTSEAGLQADLEAALDRVDGWRARHRALDPPDDGAVQAVDALEALVGGARAVEGAATVR